MNGQILEVEVIMDEPTVDQSARADRVAALLAGGVPLTLLADLAESNGPISPAILESEGLPDDAWWEAGGEGAEEARATQDDGGKAPDDAGATQDDAGQAPGTSANTAAR